MLETLDYTIRIGSTPTFLFFDLYLYSAYAAHFVYFNLFIFLFASEHCLRSVLRLFQRSTMLKTLDFTIRIGSTSTFSISICISTLPTQHTSFILRLFHLCSFHLTSEILISRCRLIGWGQIRRGLTINPGSEWDWMPQNQYRIAHEGILSRSCSPYYSSRIVKFVKLDGIIYLFILDFMY